MINVFQPSLGDEEAEAVRRVMKSNWIGRGEKAREFEYAFAEKIGVDPENLLSITSCTDGLFLLTEFLRLGRSDLIVLPSISFIAAASSIVYQKAMPLFCDSEYDTANTSADLILEAVRKHLDRASPDHAVRAIILIHYGGYPCEMNPILDLAKRNHLFVIEDNACSPFSKYNGATCGTLGDFGLWSFDAMKIMSTGDGGMLYFKDKFLRKEIERMAFLGLTSGSGMVSRNAQWWEFDIDRPARRILMNDINAAIGIEQLKKVDGFIKRRREIDALYRNELESEDWLLLPPKVDRKAQSSYYFFWVKAPRRDELAHYLRENGIYTTFRYYPLHKVSYFSERYPALTSMKNAEKIADETLCLPIHQAMTDDDVIAVCRAIREFGEKS